VVNSTHNHPQEDGESYPVGYWLDAFRKTRFLSPSKGFSETLHLPCFPFGCFWAEETLFWTSFSCFLKGMAFSAPDTIMMF
jgi:hypothetical protein